MSNPFNYALMAGGLALLGGLMTRDLLPVDHQECPPLDSCEPTAGAFSLDLCVAPSEPTVHEAFCRMRTHEACKGGCTVLVPKGDWSTGDTPVRISKPMHIVGPRWAGPATPATFTARYSRTAFSVDYKWRSVADGLGNGGSYTTFENLRIREGRRPSVVRARYGIEAWGQVRVERVWFRGFLSAVRLNAGAKRGDKPDSYRHCAKRPHECRDISNVNGWLIREVEIQYTDHAGIIVDGPDANTGLGEKIRLVHTCQRVANIELDTLDRWASKELFRNPATLEPECASIVDSAFLMNTWRASESASCGGFRAYWSHGLTNETKWDAMYGEEDCDVSVLATNSLASGGNVSWRGGTYIGHRLIKSAGGVELVSPRITLDRTLGLGPDDGTGRLMRFHFPGSESGAFYDCVADQRHHLDESGQPDLSRPYYVAGHDKLTCRYKGGSPAKWDLPLRP